MDGEPIRHYPIEQLQEFSQRVFESLGVPAADAKTAADILALSDLRGIDSHGVARLELYSVRLRDGRINPRPQFKTVRETPSTATIDGDNGLGLVVGPYANRLAMDKADQVGTGWVAVRGSNHYGIAGYYVLEARTREQIGFTVTNTSSVVAPLNGRERMLGTNPIAMAFPGLEEPPVVIDLATSAVAYGKIEMAIRKDKEIPDGWALDKDGYVTHNPNAVAAGGALLPLGSEADRGGHKGYCLGALVDLLSGPLSGANWGPFTPSFTVGRAEPTEQVGIGLGHFFGSMRIDAFADVNEFKQSIDHWIRTFRGCAPVPGTDGPMIPGDPERQAEAIRRKTGIPLIPSVVEELRRISQACRVPFD